MVHLVEADHGGRHQRQDLHLDLPQQALSACLETHQLVADHGGRHQRQDLHLDLPQQALSACLETHQLVSHPNSR